MPMLMMLRIALPVWPFHSPERTRSANADIRSSTACTSATTSTPSTISDSPFGIRSATCRTERFSVTLIRSPRNIASIALAEPDSSASAQQQRERLVGDPVLRVVEVQAGALGRQPLAPARVRGEQVAEVDVADLLVVPLERLPGGTRRAAASRSASACSSRPLRSGSGERRGLLVDVAHAGRSRRRRSSWRRRPGAWRPARRRRRRRRRTRPASPRSRRRPWASSSPIVAVVVVAPAACRRDRVHGERRAESLDVQVVRRLGVLRAGARPQQSLHPGAGVLEPLPARPNPSARGRPGRSGARPRAPRRSCRLCGHLVLRRRRPSAT